MDHNPQRGPIVDWWVTRHNSREISLHTAGIVFLRLNLNIDVYSRSYDNGRSKAPVFPVVTVSPSARSVLKYGSARSCGLSAWLNFCNGAYAGIMFYIHKLIASYRRVGYSRNCL
jgi:hypothetical protein